MNITYQREKVYEALPEMELIFPEHWKELALNQDKIPLDPDVGRYISTESQGMLHLFTARVDGKLIGYYISVVQTHPHYKSTTVAVSDMFYIKPEYRKGFIGINFFKAMEEDIRKMGAVLTMTVIKPSIDIGPMLDYLGWKLSGYIYTKYVG